MRQGMRGSGRVFVSHAYQDTERCESLLAALSSWGADTWFQEQRVEADEALSPLVEQEIAARDIFIHICSADADRSHWVRLETEAFRRQQAAERAKGDQHSRVLIFVRLDPSVERPSLEESDIYVDAAGGSTVRWRLELCRALESNKVQVRTEDESPGDEADDSTGATAALPRATTWEAIERLRELVNQLEARWPEDSVVSVAIADRASEASTAKRHAVLEVIEGASMGRTYELCKEQVTLGRKLDRDIFLMDIAVSRRHALIERDQDGRFVLRDDHSRNGTYVNERPVTEQVLADGDLIRLGKTTFRLRLPHRDD